LNCGGRGLDLPSGKVGAVVGNGQLEITHAEIESSEMKLHPRLQPMYLPQAGAQICAQLLGYTGAFFFTLRFFKIAGLILLTPARKPESQIRGTIRRLSS
jgi:hypothetical protein